MDIGEVFIGSLLAAGDEIGGLLTVESVPEKKFSIQTLTKKHQIMGIPILEKNK